MPTRAIFRCQFCDAAPDHGTQRSLQGQVTERMFGEYLDAFPGRWLVWNGGGPLGPRRYACRKHRGDLVAYLRYHYATVAAQVWKMPPYEQRWPDEKRPHMGGSMGIVKFGLRGGLLQDAPPPSKEPDKPAESVPAQAAAAAPSPPPGADTPGPREADDSRPTADDSPLDTLFPAGALYLPEDIENLPPPPEDDPPFDEDMDAPPSEGGTTWPEDPRDAPHAPESGTMWPDDDAWPPGFPPGDWPTGPEPDPPPA